MASARSLYISPTQRRIVDLVRKNAPISRADLSSLADLTPGAISRIVKELLQLGIVAEGPRLSGHRGQPALPLEISPDGGLSIGIAFCYGRLDVAVLDYAGNLRFTQSHCYEGKSKVSLLAALDPLITAASSYVSDQKGRYVGAGLALPGHRPRSGSFEFEMPASLDWMSVNELQEFISNLLETKVFLENIANAAAVSEMYSPSSPSSSDVVVLNLGHGVGCGLMLSGSIYLGALGFAGEVGRLFPTTGPRPAARDLVTALRAAGRDLPDIDALNRFPPESEAITAAWVERSALQLFELIRSIHMLISPSEVLLSGMLPAATARALADRLEELHQQDIVGQNMQAMQIKGISNGTLASVLGASWLPILAEGVPASVLQKYYKT